MKGEELEKVIVVGPLPPVAVDADRASAVRFADSGCCTTAYSYRLSHDGKEMLARRIAAALSITRGLSLEQMERMARSSTLTLP